MTEAARRWTDPLIPGATFGPWRLTRRAQHPHYTGITIQDSEPFREVAAWRTPDGESRLVSVSLNGELRVIDTASGGITARFAVGEKVIDLCVLSGSEVALVHPDGEISVWDLATGQQGRRFRARLSPVTPFKSWIDGDRTLFAFASDTEGIDIRDAATGKRVDSPLRGRGSGLNDLATVTAPGNRQLLAVAQRLGGLEVWEPCARKRKQRLVSSFTPPGRPTTSCLTSIAAWRLGDDVRVAAATGPLEEQSILVLDALTGEVVHTITAEGLISAAPLLVLTHPDGPRLFALSGDGTCHTWDATTGERLSGPLVAPFGHTTHAMLCPDGQIALVQQDGAAITITDGSFADPPSRPVGKPVWMAPTRDLNVLLGEGRKVREWDLIAGKPVGPALTSKAMAICGTVLDGSRMVIGYLDGAVRLWDRAAADPAKRITSWTTNPHLYGVSAITAWREGDQQRVATGGQDGTIRVWDPDTGRQVGPTLKHDDEVRQVVTYTDSAGNRRLVSSGQDCAVRFWSAEGHQVANHVEEAGWVVDLVALRSRQGKPRVAGASENGELLLFDGEDGTLLGSWMPRDGGSPISVTALPDHTLVYLTDIGTLHHVDPETGQELSHTEIDAYSVEALPDGSLALVCRDGWLMLEPT